MQGVGFRPFVHGAGGELGLAGFVGNDETGVVIEAEGPRRRAVDALLAALRERPPALARGDRRDVGPDARRGDDAFTIAAAPRTAGAPR